MVGVTVVVVVVTVVVVVVTVVGVTVVLMVVTGPACPSLYSHTGLSNHSHQHKYQH